MRGIDTQYILRRTSSVVVSSVLSLVSASASSLDVATNMYMDWFAVIAGASSWAAIAILFCRVWNAR